MRFNIYTVTPASPFGSRQTIKEFLKGVRAPPVTVAVPLSHHSHATPLLQEKPERSREGNAPLQARDRAQRPRAQDRPQPQAGDRDRPEQGAQEGREGSAHATALVSDVAPPEG